MSAKWIRSKKWDDQFFPAWAWPAKAVLRAFSSIWLAVILLSLVGVFGILASVPIGLLALIPTKLVYALSVLAVVAVVAIVPIVLVRRAWRGESPWRFVFTVVGGVGLTVVAWQLWQIYAWPRLHWDPATNTGVRFFGDFVERYASTTLRRLPGMEMSELEFYSWWPLRVILLAFVVNMVTATLRRIEFSFVNLGVLTVHTGIVTIALGSTYYSGMKKEGDTLLLAGEPGADGKPTPGPPVRNFYDNTKTVLYIRQEGKVWEMRPLSPPRYNDYGLSAHLGSAGDSAMRVLGRSAAADDAGRRLDEAVTVYPGVSPIVDGDITLRLVGYASYAEAGKDWIAAPLAEGQTAVPARFARLEIPPQALPEGAAPKQTGFAFYFLPTRAKDRLGETEAFGLEYTLSMPEQRWRDLQQTSPLGANGRSAEHVVVVEIPRGGVGGGAFTTAVALDTPGRAISLGDTGWTIALKELHEKPPFPIVSKGFENAQSSVAIVRVTPPGGKPAFDRWLYHRFPEITQDLSGELNERGMPTRSAPNAAIRLAYLDNSKLQVYLDESAAGAVRSIVRVPGQPPRLIGDVGKAGRIESIVKDLHLQLMDRWPHVEEMSVPVVVPPEQREKEHVGTHGKAMACIEISSPKLVSGNGEPVTRRVWVPFSKYLGVDAAALRSIELADGRKFQLAFGRQAHELPGFMVQLLDFQMIPYEHRGSPRDYKSVVRVVPDHTSEEGVRFAAYEHVTELNAPLQAPFIWDEKRSWLSNAAGTLLSRLNPRQFKFSQAGWDPTTWNRTQEMVDRGELPRPYASFTILGVGNNPGIHVIALGGILMSLGIPWAFYVKPWLIKRRKSKLQEMLAASPRPPRNRGEPATQTATPTPAQTEEVGAKR